MNLKGRGMYENSYLIRSLKYSILSFHSFVFWASVLVRNEDAIITVPKSWTPNYERQIYLPSQKRGLL